MLYVCGPLYTASTVALSEFRFGYIGNVDDRSSLGTYGYRYGALP